MHVDAYQLDGGHLTALKTESAAETVHIHALPGFNWCGVEWTTPVDATETLETVELLMGNVALGPHTELHTYGTGLKGSGIQDIAAATEMARGLDIRGMTLDIGELRVLQWVFASRNNPSRHSISFSANKRQSFDHVLVSKLVMATASPELLAQAQEVEDRVGDLLGSYAR